MKPLLAGQKLFDDISPVDGASIPHQFDVSTQVAQEMPQELEHLLALDVGDMELGVEPQTLALRRHGDTGNSRDPLPGVAVPEQGSLAHRRPGLGDVGNKQESAFIEERQMGVTLLGFFLYAARWSSSIARWRLRPAGSLAVLVSASSIGVQRTLRARREWFGSERQNVCESRPQFGSRSIGRWNSRRLAILSTGFASAFLSAIRISGRDVPRSVLPEAHAVPSSCRCDTTERPISSWRSRWRRPSGTASRF